MTPPSLLSKGTLRKPYGTVKVAVAVSAEPEYDATIWYVPVGAELSVQTWKETPSYAQEIVDTAGVSVAALVISIVPPFETALTLNFALPPLVVMLAVVGLIAIELITRNTVAVAVELSACESAVIVEVPVVTPVNMPVLGSIVATVGVALDQETPVLI